MLTYEQALKDLQDYSAEIALLRLAIEGDRDVWDIVDIKNAEIERLRDNETITCNLRDAAIAEIERLRAALGEIAADPDTPSDIVVFARNVLQPEEGENK